MTESLLTLPNPPALPQQEDGLAQELQGPAATEDAHGGEFDLGADVLAHHILDAREYELPFFSLHLPESWVVHIGGLALDLSPTKHTVLMFLAAAISTVLVLIASRTVAVRGVSRAPSGFANAVEAMVVFFRDEVCKSNIGRGYERFVPFVLTLFFFILVMNLLGLVPWGGSATGNLSVTAALAAVTFVVTEVSGFRALGFSGYMRTIFYAPPGMGGIGKFFMLCLMTPVELMSKITKPFALAVRLFANMTAGHMLIFSLMGLIFVFADVAFARWFVAGASFSMVTLILLMELLIAVIQAYVFAMLSAVFIGLMQHEH